MGADVNLTLKLHLTNAYYKDHLEASDKDILKGIVSYFGQVLPAEDAERVEFVSGSIENKKMPKKKKIDKKIEQKVEEIKKEKKKKLKQRVKKMKATIKSKKRGRGRPKKK